MSYPILKMEVKKRCEFCDGHGYYIPPEQIKFLDTWKNSPPPAKEVSDYKKMYGYSPIAELHKEPCNFCRVSGYRDTTITLEELKELINK